MSQKFSRRDFVMSGAVAGLAGTSIVTKAENKSPGIKTQSPSKPVVISSRNGITKKRVRTTN